VEAQQSRNMENPRLLMGKTFHKILIAKKVLMIGCAEKILSGVPLP